MNNNQTAADQTPAPTTSQPFRKLDEFLSDAAGFRVTEEAAIENAFLAFGKQKATELYSEEYIRRWKAESPGKEFTFALDLLEDCGYTAAMGGTMTYLEIACKLYDFLPKVTNPAGIRSCVNQFNQYHLSMLCIDHLAQWCFFNRK